MYRMNALVLACALLVAISHPAFAADEATKNLVAEGNVQYRQFKFKEALDKYDAAIEKDAAYAMAHNNRGLALQKLGRLDDAIAAINKAAQLDPKRAAYYLNLAKLHAVVGNYELALLACNTAVLIDPELTAAVYNQVWILDEKGDSLNAGNSAAKLGNAANGPHGTKMLLGIVAARQGKADDLASACGDAEDLSPHWRWLRDLNRCLGTGGTADLSEKARAALREALHALSTEQFELARERLAAAEEAAPRSCLPPWVSAMSWVAEGKGENANAAMKKVESLKPRLELAAGNETLVLFVDGVRAGPAPVSFPVLPGAHVVSVEKSGSAGSKPPKVVTVTSGRQTVQAD